MAGINKILIVGELYGYLAPGLVAENLCEGLSKYSNEIDLLTSKFHPRKHKPNGRVYHYRIRFRKYIRKYISHIYYNVKYFFWKKVFKEINFSKYDMIFLIVSNGYDVPINIAALDFGKKRPVILAYFVDAMPPPYPYFEGDKQRANIAKFINSKLINIDKIYSTCLEMSEFQRTIIENKSIAMGELYNPSTLPELIHFKSTKTNRTFIYAGSIYYPRNVNYILDALAEVIKKYPDVKLIFVGSNIKKLKSKKFNSLSKNIEVLPYTKDLNSLYENCSALVDINCDVKQDIYMSSKLTSYFAYCKPIICESSSGSPARRVFANLETVIHCDHCAQELKDAMFEVLEAKKPWDYTEREGLLKELSIPEVTKKIIEDYYNYSKERK